MIIKIFSFKCFVIDTIRDYKEMFTALIIESLRNTRRNLNTTRDLKETLIHTKLNWLSHLSFSFQELVTNLALVYHILTSNYRKVFLDTRRVVMSLTDMNGKYFSQSNLKMDIGCNTNRKIYILLFKMDRSEHDSEDISVVLR